MHVEFVCDVVSDLFLLFLLFSHFWFCCYVFVCRCVVVHSLVVVVVPILLPFLFQSTFLVGLAIAIVMNVFPFPFYLFLVLLVVFVW